ncbi:unnamed protein product [Amaranthus hypochondriacus]
MAELSSCISNCSPPRTSTTQRLLGKVALVTGAAAGIGESIVRLFHSHGASVCIVDINDKAGQQVCESIDDSKVIFFPCDVSKEDDIKRAIDFTVERLGTLDILVNNAGISDTPFKGICDVNSFELDNVLDINVKGTIYGMKHAARIMIPSRKGSIISLSSGAAVIAGVCPHVYTASKHAIIGLTKNVAAELGKYGIRVNCVSPYAVLTNMALAHVPEDERTDDVVAGFQDFVKKKANLQGVELTAEDIANAVLFLASDEARYISAENLVVDGGFASVNHTLRTFR